MIHVASPYLPPDDKFRSYVDRIFRSRMLTNHGELVQLLQERLARYLGVEHLLLVANGTLALQIAYKLLKLSGEAVTTPFSFVATTSSLVWEGIRPVFSDIDPETFNLDPARIEDKITPRTSAIVPVHVFGNVCRVEEFERIARRRGLRIVYDAAHAFGVRYRGESVLRYGDVSILSFHATKVFHSIEGGALIMQDPDLFRQARRMMDFGISGPDQVASLGINAKMNEFEAAMGLCVLDDIERILAGRRAVWERYLAYFRDMPGIQLQKRAEDATWNYSYCPVAFRDEETALKIQRALQREQIAPRRYFHPSLDTLDYVQSEPMPHSRSLSSRILCLPVYDSLATEDQTRIIRIIQSQLQEG